MSTIPTCCKCEKSVYPMEELKCLDKMFHKGCFRCTTCNSALNLRTFCGYNKEPYCKAHYPKDKHTVVLDTPENLNAQKNSKQQSMINYHAEYEKQKGKSGVAKPDVTA